MLRTGCFSSELDGALTNLEPGKDPKNGTPNSEPEYSHGVDYKALVFSGLDSGALELASQSRILPLQAWAKPGHSGMLVQASMHSCLLPLHGGLAADGGPDAIQQHEAFAHCPVPERAHGPRSPAQ